MPIRIGTGSGVPVEQSLSNRAIDIAEHGRETQRLSVQYEVSRVLAESASLADAAPWILRVIGEGLEWEYGALWMIDQHDNVLRCVDTWHAPPAECPQLEAINRQITFSAGVGFVGRVWVSAEAMSIADILQEANFARLRVAASEGLHGYLAFPLILSGEVLGVFEFFSRSVQRANDETLHMLGVLGSQIGQFIERRRAEERQQFLIEASEVISSSLDYETILQRVAQLAVPHIADWCAVHVVDDDGQIRRLAVEHVDPHKVELARQLQERYPVDPNSPTGVANVLRTGQSEYHPEIPESLLVLAARDDEHLRVLRELDMRTSMVVPLLARGLVLGAITLVAAESGKQYGPADLALAEDLGRRAGVAMDNARLHAELRRTNEAQLRMAAIIESSDDAILSKNLDGTIVSWNPGAERLYGYSAREVVGLSVSLLVPPDRPDEIPVILERLSRGERIDHYETVRVRKDGTRLNVSVTISPVKDQTGSIIGASAIARDITERKQAEAQREELLAQVSNALELRNQFLSVASHELKTPVTLLKGHAQLLEKQAQHQNDTAILRSVQVMQRQTERMSSLINQLLDVSQIASGRLEFEMSPFDLTTAVVEVIDEVSLSVPRFNLRLDRQPESIRVTGDRVRLQQVITNLLTNAIKYSDKRQEVDISITRDRYRALVEVSDYGIGIPEEQQPQVFEMYFRGANASTNNYAGLGLGLFISKTIIERHGGTFSLLSEEGKGSSFCFSLPLAASG